MNINLPHDFSKSGLAKNRRFMKVKEYLDFDEFCAEKRVFQMGIFYNQIDLMQFINYVLRVQSTQKLFIVAPALFRKLLHTYNWLDIYPETVGIATIGV